MSYITSHVMCMLVRPDSFIEADSLHKIGCLLYLVYLDDDGLIL